MKNQLIQLYLFVCHVYDTRSEACFQRLSNNSNPAFTDRELVTIWFFAHFNKKYEKKDMHRFILEYWADWFPRLLSYQTFCYRLNLLEQTFQSIGAELMPSLLSQQTPEFDHLIDSMPVMLAKHGHAYGAKVARDIADVGYAQPRKPGFTASACTLSPNDALRGCRIRRNFGSVKPPITIRPPLANNIWSCRTAL